MLTAVPVYVARLIWRISEERYKYKQSLWRTIVPAVLKSFRSLCLSSCLWVMLTALQTCLSRRWRVVKCFPRSLLSCVYHAIIGALPKVSLSLSPRLFVCPSVSLSLFANCCRRRESKFAVFCGIVANADFGAIDVFSVRRLARYISGDNAASFEVSL